MVCVGEWPATRAWVCNLAVAISGSSIFVAIQVLLGAISQGPADSGRTLSDIPDTVINGLAYCFGMKPARVSE